MREQKLNKKYKAREDVVFTDLDDGSAVLLHLETKYYFSLNESGCFLWKLLERDQGASEDDLASEMCGAYDVDDKRAREDVSEFIHELSQQDLIK